MGNKISDIPVWPTSTPKWSLDHRTLLLEGEIEKPSQVSLEEVEEKSAAFPIKFPIDTARCKVLKNNVSTDILERNINSAYPVLSEDALLLYANFILFKRVFGSDAEKKLYANMSITGLVDRFLLKRAVLFVGESDKYILLDGQKGYGIDNVELDKSLNYDEIKLSALLSVSSYSYFINNGKRRNGGVVDHTDVEEEGIVVGLIGTRLVKPNVMEYQEIVISEKQNCEGNGYGLPTTSTLPNLILGFYGDKSFTYEEIRHVMKRKSNRFFEVEPGLIFDKHMYSKRLTLSFDVLLHEANSRAQDRNTTAFIHVVGIGLGVWRLATLQPALFLDTFAERIKILGKNLYFVSDVVYAYFGDSKSSGGYKNGDIIPILGHPNGGINIYFSERQPHTKLTGNDKGKLLVVSYAWDGNSLPGNEFWIGSLGSSGDPAQACSSQVAELHNAHINSRVCGANLRIATSEGLLPFSTYRQKGEKHSNMANISDIPTWPTHSPKWILNYKKVLLEGEIVKPERVSLAEIERKSATFPIKFPIETARCAVLKAKVPVDILERNINSVYPVLSEDALPLYVNFILFKRQFGNEDERQLYANMTIIDLVDRLLLKRAVLFVGDIDKYILLDGRKGYGIQNLKLSDCLTYDEIKLSALLSVSSYSYFINDGNRHNVGVVQHANVEEEGIVVGLIGTRFEKPNVMEYQETIITEKQNHEGNGYGPHFAPTLPSIICGFYGDTCFTYRQIEHVMKQQPNRFLQIEPGVIFDKHMYSKRLTLSFDVLLHEANSRAQERNTTAFVHVVGIGLGVWKLSSVQHSLFLDTFAKRINILGNSLHFVSDIVFAYFGDNKSSGGYKDGDIIPIPGHPKGGIKIYFSQRQPHTKLKGNDIGKLLVISYAWDGNALPGNEFWGGSLAGSGDPAQACSSQVAELHNSHINTQACGANLRIATHDGLVSFTTYREKIAQEEE